MATKAGRRASRSRGKEAAEAFAQGFNSGRSTLAKVVWIIAALCAAVLAMGAALIALGANTDNSIVQFVLDAADSLDLGLFSRKNGIFTFDGKNAETKAALVNWGIAAVVYLVVGRILSGVIAPKA